MIHFPDWELTWYECSNHKFRCTSDRTTVFAAHRNTGDTAIWLLDHLQTVIVYQCRRCLVIHKTLLALDQFSVIRNITVFRSALYQYTKLFGPVAVTTTHLSLRVRVRSCSLISWFSCSHNH